MLKLAGNLLLLAVVVVLGSCLKRPEKRAPRYEGQTNPTLPVIETCAGQGVSARAGEMQTKCRRTTTPTSTPTNTGNTDTDGNNETTDTGDKTETSDEEEDSSELEPVALDRSLATIGVVASCYEDGEGCLYADGSDKKYWLICNISGGGCKDGLSLRVDTAVNDALPQVKRSSMCKGGDKTVADLSTQKIKLICKTDQEVLKSFTPKTQELILGKQHLDGRHLCITTIVAGIDGVKAFKEGDFLITAGKCVDADDAIHFSMQLDFAWQ